MAVTSLEPCPGHLPNALINLRTAAALIRGAPADLFGIHSERWRWGILRRANLSRGRVILTDGNPDAVSPVPPARLRGNCSSMVRSLAFSRLVAALSLAAFLSFSPLSSHAREISEAPTEPQGSTNESTSSSSTRTVPDPADLHV